MNPGMWRDPADRRHPEIERLYGYFEYSHLPPRLQNVSGHFAVMADVLLDILPDSPELTVCLRKLLEAKDCAVRAALVQTGSEKD